MSSPAIVQNERMRKPALDFQKFIGWRLRFTHETGEDVYGREGVRYTGTMASLVKTFDGEAAAVHMENGKHHCEIKFLKHHAGCDVVCSFPSFRKSGIS